MALNAGGNNLESPVRSGGLVLWYFLHDFGSVMFPQPGRQLSCSSFPIRDAEPARLGRPPWRNAAVTDEFANIEKRTDPLMPDGKPAPTPWHLMTYEFRMRPGDGAAPKPLGAKTTVDA